MTRLWEPFRGSEIVLKHTKVQRTDLKLVLRKGAGDETNLKLFVEP